MPLFRAEVTVTLKPVVNDPQGLVIRDSLHHLGFDAVRDVRAGKHIALDVEAADADAAERDVAAMCEKLLRNPVIEDYRVRIADSAGVAAE